MKKITTFFFAALVACSAFAGKPTLKDAVMKQDINKVKELLNNGADANETWSGNSALYWAAWKGGCDMIKLLVEKGAKVDATTGTLGETALYGVVNDPIEPATIIAENKKTNEKIFKRFTEEKCRKEGWAANDDSTAFSTPADKVKLLIELGADPNFLIGTMTVKSGSPFLQAVKKENLQLVKVMLDTKKVDTENRFDQWNEKVAGMVHRLEASKYINEKKMLDWAKLPQYNTPLIYAVEKKNLALVKILVEGGADIDNGKKITKGSTMYWFSPLDIANSNGLKDIAAYLKEKGAKAFQE